MLTKGDIDWLKRELVPALSDQVKKDISTRLDWITTMLDKQSGNITAIQTELTLIRGSLDESNTANNQLVTRIERIEKNLHLSPLVG